MEISFRALKWKNRGGMRIANSQTNGTGSDLMAEHRKEGRDPKDNVSVRIKVLSWTLARPFGLVVKCVDS